MEEQGITALPLEGGTTSQEFVHPMSQLMEEDFARARPDRGEIVEGIIVSMNSQEIMVDISSKSEGVVQSRDLERLDADYRQTLRVGGKVWVYVVRPEDAQGNTILSLSRAQVETDWQKASELFDSGDILEEAVSGANRGGLIVNVGRVRGFVPASQVYSVRLSPQADDNEREEQLGQLVGQKLHLKIIELDRRRNRLILSERAATREWRQTQKERLLDDLREGDVRQGIVSSLCDFGAFVDMGGADGLVHLSELSWSRVGHPKEVLKIDQKVDVYVLGVDRDRRRIALSIKRLKAEPWSTVTERYQIGQVVTGTITNITDFGAFARLDEDIEGLVHISELSEERIDHPNAVVKEGDEVTVRIIRIDPDRQRMGLSMRRVNDDPYDEYDWQESDQLADLENSAEDGEE